MTLNNLFIIPNFITIIILIILGIILLQILLMIQKMQKQKKVSEIYATFSTENITCEKEKFENCELNAIFGKIKYNMTSAIINKEATINIYSIFGITSIEVNNDTKVIINSLPIFGKINIKKKNINETNTLYINALCLFGRIDIK